MTYPKTNKFCVCYFKNFSSSYCANLFCRVNDSQKVGPIYVHYANYSQYLAQMAPFGLRETLIIFNHLNLCGAPLNHQRLHARLYKVLTPNLHSHTKLDFWISKKS